MKCMKFVLVCCLTTCFAQKIFAQTAYKHQKKSIISRKIVVLKHIDTLDGLKKLRTDTLNIPVADKSRPRLRISLRDKKILFDQRLKEVQKDYADCGCGIVGLDYKISFESKDIISLQLTFKTEAAYPDIQKNWLTLNVHTGRPYPLSAEINSKGMERLFKMYKDTLLKRIKEDKESNSKEDTSTYNELNANIKALTRGELFSKYVFTNTDIILSIDPILPHVIREEEPNDDVSIPYEQLKAYIAPGSIVLKSAKQKHSHR
jgi:hypothetical protein